MNRIYPGSSVAASGADSHDAAIDAIPRPGRWGFPDFVDKSKESLHESQPDLSPLRLVGRIDLSSDSLPAFGVRFAQGNQEAPSKRCLRSMKALVTGVMADITDMAMFQELLQSDEGQKAMWEDDMNFETMRMLIAFTP